MFSHRRGTGTAGGQAPAKSGPSPQRQNFNNVWITIHEKPVVERGIFLRPFGPARPFTGGRAGPSSRHPEIDTDPSSGAAWRSGFLDKNAGGRGAIAFSSEV